MGQYDQVLSKDFLKNINQMAIRSILVGCQQAKLKLDGFIVYK